MDLRTQLELEGSLVEQGVNRFMKSVDGAEEGGRATDTMYGQQLLKNLVLPISEAIADTLTNKTARKHGKYLTVMKELDSTVLAFITLKTLLNTLHNQTTATKLSNSIGSNVEDEVRFKMLLKANPEYYDVVLKDLRKKKTKSYRHVRNVLSITAKKRGVEWDHWDSSAKVAVGALLLNSVISTTDLVEVKKVRKRIGSKNVAAYVTPTAECLEWVSKFNTYMSVLDPYTKPCVIEPDDWTSLKSGGYWSEPMRERVPLVKNMRGSQEEFYEQFDIARTRLGVNLAQRTPWQVNTKVLDVLKQVWTNPVPIGLPRKTPYEIPPYDKEVDLETMSEREKEEFTLWKRKAAALYTKEVARQSKAYGVSTVVSMASQYSRYDQFWFVYQLDSRGRMYASSSGLSPQGTDYNKALLKFKNGRPLGEKGLFWLAVHGANCFGVDKVSFKDRVKWAADNLGAIRATADNPLNHTDFWGGADKPYQFLAFCFEFAEAAYMKDNSNFVSYLPVGMDGSCNGLQNFSALLRDPVGGAATNLVPTDVPADIYQVVVDKTFEFIRTDVDSPERNYWMSFERDHGASRKLAKRAVMTLPYGSTKYSCLEFVYEALDDLGYPVEEGANKPIAYFANILWDSISSTVIAARTAMDWLQGIADATASKGVPMWWVNPVGFPVLQDNKKVKYKQVETSLMGKMRLRLQEDTQELSKSKQKQGIAPNFVHSLDAAHMMLCMIEANELGITDFAMIHDDFGVHAGLVQPFRECIKKSFVDMYDKSEPLHELYTNMSEVLSDLEPPPEKGDLDLNNVLNSDYFFS